MTPNQSPFSKPFVFAKNDVGLDQVSAHVRRRNPALPVASEGSSTTKSEMTTFEKQSARINIYYILYIYRFFKCIYAQTIICNFHATDISHD